MRDISSIPVFSQYFSNFPTCSLNTDIPTSIKGSCSIVPPILEDDKAEDDKEDIPKECELC